MNRLTNAPGNSIPAYQVASRDLEDIGEVESSRSVDPAMAQNRASVISFEGNPDDKIASAKFNVWKGSWRWDIRTDTMLWSEQLYRMIGRESATIPPFREHFRFYTSESWIRLVDATLELLKTGTPYELRLEMLHSDGSRKWVICEGEPMCNERGEIVELRGTVQDITESALQVGKTAPTLPTGSNAEDATRRLIQAQEENARLVTQFHANVCERLALLAERIQRFRSALRDLSLQSDAQIEPLLQETGGTLGEMELREPGPTASSTFND